MRLFCLTLLSLTFFTSDLFSQARHDGSVIGRRGNGMRNEGFFQNIFGSSISKSQGGGNTGVGADGDIPKNILKTNLSSISYGVYSLQYERAVTTKMSLALQARYMPNRKFAGVGSYSIEDDYFTTNFKFSSYAFTPEARIYVRQAMKGFYFAPYFRYRAINMSLPVEYSDGTTTNRFVGEAAFTTLAGGLMIGSNFKIGPISLDWFIAGGHYSSSTLKLEYTHNKNFTATEISDINSTLSDLQSSSSSFFKFDYAVGSNYVNLNTNGISSFGLRGAGINLGYRF